MNDVTIAGPANGGLSRTGNDQEAPATSLNLFEIWAAIYRSRWGVGAIFATCFAVAAIYSIFATPYYESAATVEIKQEAEKVLGTEADREGAASKMDTDRFLQTQLDIIRSRATANTVAESLQLYRGDTFLNAMHVSEDLDRRGVLSEQEAKREQVIKALRRNFSVGYTGETRLASLSFSAPDPRLSAQIANSFAESFIRGNLARKLDSSSYALDFLRTQLSEAQARLERSEQDAVNYARLKRIVDASNAATDGKNNQPQSLITAQLVQLNESIAQATADRIGAQQKWEKTASLPLMNIPEVLTNQAIQGMLQKRAEAETSYREQLANRREDHPSVVQARSAVGTIESQISIVARSIRASIKNQYDVAKSREQQLLRTVDTLKGDTLTEQNQSIQLSILRREAETNRAQYDALLKRFNELNAESGVQTNNLAIVDRAQVAVAPSWPKLPLNIALAVVAGLLLSALLVLIRAQVFDAIRTPNDVVDRLQLPLLGTVPQDPAVIEQLRDSKSMISEAFNSIRTSLSLASEHGVPKSMMVTSAQQGEGKSSTCHALALSFARLGKSVIVVDVDLRRPNAHRLFELENKIGLSHFLSGQVTLDKVLRSSGVKNIDLITAGDIPPNPTEQLSGVNFAPLIDELTGRYDAVLLDAAPILGLADAVVIGHHVEATLFVIEAGRNTVRGAKSALERLDQGRCTIVGGILTKFDASRMGYGYSEYYGYHYSYGSDQKE
jgi:capsular exopolysaccharide synthesis family protein